METAECNPRQEPAGATPPSNACRRYAGCREFLRSWRCGELGRVRSGIGILRNRALEHIGEEDDVILPDAIASVGRDRGFEFLTITPVPPAGFYFIISAPDHNAGMIAQALDLVDRFLPDVFLEGYVTRNHVAAEHEFLPNHDAELVADVVKIVRLVISAAPLTNHVHVRVAGGLQNVADESPG